jgi:hypothetical protein
MTVVEGIMENIPKAQALVWRMREKCSSHRLMALPILVPKPGDNDGGITSVLDPTIVTCFALPKFVLRFSE